VAWPGIIPRRAWWRARMAVARRPAASQRLSSCRISSSSIRTWRTIWLLMVDSRLAASPSSRCRAPPMV